MLLIDVTLVLRSTTITGTGGSGIGNKRLRPHNNVSVYKVLTHKVGSNGWSQQAQPTLKVRGLALGEEVSGTAVSTKPTTRQEHRWAA